MQAVNHHKHKEIAVHLSYSEAHFIGEALFHYKFMLQKHYGSDSVEEERISTMLYTIRNPELGDETF